MGSEMCIRDSAKSLLSRTMESRVGVAAALRVALRASNFFNDAISADSSACMRARVGASNAFSRMCPVAFASHTAVRRLWMFY